jgi:hypothetical protein
MKKTAMFTCLLFVMVGFHFLLPSCAKSPIIETMGSHDPFSFPTIGETITNGELDLVVTSAKPIKTINGQDADSGYVFLAVLFEYRNIASYALDYNELPMVGLDDAEFHQYKALDELASIYGSTQGIDFSVLMDPLQPNTLRQDTQVFLVPINVCNNQYLYLTFDIFTQEVELNIDARE